jgi:DNA-binding transcriptional MocR family regulator
MSDYRYRQLADDLRTRIHARHWHPGERLPSVRMLMAEQSASMATAVRALQRLEQLGYVVSRPRSGWFVAAQLPKTQAANWTTFSAPAAVPVSVGRQIYRVLASVSQPGLLPLGSAVVDVGLLPLRELRRATMAVARTHPDIGLRPPTSPLGNPALRVQIARLMAQRGVHVGPEQIVVTAGDGLAFEMALRLVVPAGGVVAIETPTYFGILQSLEALGLHALEIATDARSGIDLDALEAALREGGVHAIAVNPTFHNPFGGLMSDAAKARLVALASRYQVPLIEDDVYGDLYQGARRPLSLQSFDRDGNVIHCSSFSKTLTPAWRIGWITPGRWLEAFVERQLLSAHIVNTLSQAILAEYLAGRAYAQHLQRLRKLFAAQNPRVRALILAAFPDALSVTDPQGSFLFWIELPVHVDATALAGQALRNGISIAPGPIFSATRRFRNCIRLSVGQRLTPAIEAGIRTLGELAR